MKLGQLLVFAGDALSYLTGGRILALMHSVRCRPTAPGPTRQLVVLFLVA